MKDLIFIIGSLGVLVLLGVCIALVVGIPAAVIIWIIEAIQS